MHKDEVEIMLAKPSEHTPFDKPTFTGSFYIRTDSVDELWSKLKDNIDVCYPLENFERGMREYAVYDNNGYMLQFRQEVTETN